MTWNAHCNKMTGSGKENLQVLDSRFALILQKNTVWTAVEAMVLNCSALEFCRYIRSFGGPTTRLEFQVGSLLDVGMAWPSVLTVPRFEAGPHLAFGLGWVCCIYCTRTSAKRSNITTGQTSSLPPHGGGLVREMGPRLFQENTGFFHIYLP